MHDPIVVKIMQMTREHRVDRVHDTLEKLGIRPTRYDELLRDFVSGRAGDGNSFEPPGTPFAKVMSAVMPAAMNLRFRLLGRPDRR